MLRSQFVLFLVVGGVAAAANFASRIAFNHWIGYAWAVTLAYCIGMATAFALNRLFVFKHSSQAVHHQAIWFVVVNLFALAQTLAVSVLLAKVVFPRVGFAWHPDSVAHLVGIMLPLVSSYFGHKYLSFRH
ncbi:GtrA family protein [Luteibacter sp. UNCMF331Sha3.1]|uniref:GtrA family protein n=1 Tax=Luteibacter sp. UNCMF331Sha3.1 TaxID=1502760 RepID=UPI000B7D0E4F|nr:GtrA family protein [Luteibacter sp. UNCMF331Sha3.1]